MSNENGNQQILIRKYLEGQSKAELIDLVLAMSRQDRNGSDLYDFIIRNGGKGNAGRYETR